MTLQTRKIPILTGINDVPSVSGDEKHPNASLLCKNYNDLIDNEISNINSAIATIPTTATIRQAITVTGSATYNSSTGVITVNNADLSVDHVSLTNTNGRFKTYTIWADFGETVQLGQFTVADGTNGIDGRNIEKVTSADNGNGTKIITFWGDVGETINLGSLILASGVDGANGTDGRGITNTSYNASTGVLTLTFSDNTTFNTGSLKGADGVSPSVSVLTQSAYNALGSYDSNTFYVINN